MQHQLVGLGGMMAQFENRTLEYALFMEMGCGKPKFLLMEYLFYMTMEK